MSQSKLGIAEDNLVEALKNLGLAIDHRIAKEATMQDLELQLRIAHEDRADLAERLDQALSEISNMENKSREVGLKIDRAMDSINSVLAKRRSA